MQGQMLHQITPARVFRAAFLGFSLLNGDLAGSSRSVCRAKRYTCLFTPARARHEGILLIGVLVCVLVNQVCLCSGDVLQGELQMLIGRLSSLLHRLLKLLVQVAADCNFAGFGQPFY